MTDEDQILKAYFTRGSPLGEINAPEGANYSDARVLFRSYFDFDNGAYQELHLEPSMIVGRKGSGKTDTLLSYEFGDNPHNKTFSPIVHFESADSAAAISSVVNQITDAIYDDYPRPRVEEVASFWDSIFWVTILSAIVRDRTFEEEPEFGVIEKCILALLNTTRVPESPFSVIIEAIVEIKSSYAASKYAEANLGLFTAYSKLSYSGYSINDAKLAALIMLRRKKMVALVLFDSIENLDLDAEIDLLAISGLLKAVGAFNDFGASAQFRCCIPAEAYFKISDMSQNPLKDFKNVHRLHWNSAELLKISAKRYLTFLKLHDMESAKNILEEFNNFSKRKDVIKFWNSILPSRVPNTKKDEHEATLPYITRHTQLLPRHMIFLLNKILSKSIAISGEVCPQKASVESVIESVRVAEAEMVAEILGSYKSVWPDAADAISAVFPTLGSNIVSHSTLYRAFNKSSVYSGQFQNIANFHDYLRMLCELGAIGRLIEKTDHYAVAVFEYHEPSKLIFTPMDTLCVHPIFTERFGVIVRERVPEDYMPVYPLGTDPKAKYFS